jgi:hypothetical protein
MAILYHYTSPYHLGKILADGFLKVVESNIAQDQEHAGPDVVWLDNQRNLLGQGAAKVGWASMRPGAEAVDKTAVRFTVEVDDAERWVRFAHRHHADPNWVSSLNRAGSNMQSHWWVVEHPITREQWRAITVRQSDGSIIDINPLTDIEVWGDGDYMQVSIPNVELRR